MLIRIVKMSFKDDKIELFLKIFNNSKEKIRNFEGCRLLQLLRDKKNPSLFFTYSYWESDKQLELYRNSELFKSVWAETKALFNSRPEAWSVETIESLP